MLYRNKPAQMVLHELIQVTRLSSFLPDPANISIAMKHSTLSLAKAFSPLLLVTVPLASAKCNSMKLLGSADGEDAAPSTSTDKQIFRVSDIIECDSINGEVTLCDVPPQDPVALSLHPEVRGTDFITSKTNVFDLIRAQASDSGLAGANFNSTVYYNYSIPEGGAPSAASPRNYFFWTPRFRCWQGTLHDCDDADKQVQDKNITGCALVWEDGTEGLPLGRQAYRGLLMGIQDVGGNFFLNGTEESQPKSADFDWAAAEAEIEENNPASQQSGTGAGIDLSGLKLMGQGLGVAWLSTFLLQ